MRGQGQQEWSGCGTLIVAIFLFGVAVAAAISLAAIVDPFSWLPPVGEIWEDCERNYDTSADDCALATRFPGFWPHTIANLAYLVAATGLLARLALAVVELRAARAARLSPTAMVDRYDQARQRLALVASLVGLLGALPIVVATA
jgi:hypothetical protein